MLFLENILVHREIILPVNPVNPFIMKILIQTMVYRILYISLFLQSRHKMKSAVGERSRTISLRL